MEHGCHVRTQRTRPIFSKGSMMFARLTLIISLFATVSFAQTPSKDFGKARELRNSDTWINGSPLKLQGLRGKVVVIDFWAFDCEPCIETTPHIIDLYDKYSKEGLVVIGVHTPRAE